MANNRRNYYRILNVQPEAPDLVITASYRTMMSKLRLHPDLGGDTAGAALINEAYTVLRDPESRAKYDQQQRRASVSGRFGTVARSAPATNHEPDPFAACPFCRAPVPVQIVAKTRCRRCESPLAPPPERPTGKKELFGRRTVPRMSRSDSLTLIPGWQSPARAAQLHNLSFTGVSVITDVKFERHQVIRVIGSSIDLLASVVNCRGDGRSIQVNASLRTAIFRRPTGTVVSVTA